MIEDTFALGRSIAINIMGNTEKSSLEVHCLEELHGCGTVRENGTASFVVVDSVDVVRVEVFFDGRVIPLRCQATRERRVGRKWPTITL